MPLPHDIYVDSDIGSDENEGTVEAPLLTLERALDLRNQRLENTDLPVRIFEAHCTPMGRRWDEPFDEANALSRAAPLGQSPNNNTARFVSEPKEKLP